MHLLLLALGTVRAEPGDPADAPQANPTESAPDAGWTHHVYPSGLEVTVLADPLLPITATHTWVHVGGAHERPDQRGFAHLFEHMMFGASGTRERGEYGRFHDRVGGRRNAYTSYDETVYVSAVPPEHLLTVLDMEAERFTQLLIDPDEMAKDREVVIEELRKSTENNARDRILQSFQHKLFEDHPYAYRAIGTKEHIAARTVEEAQAFYEAYYRPDHMHLVIVGPVDRQEVLAAVDARYSAMTPSGVVTPEVPAVSDTQLPARIRVSDSIRPVLAVGLVYPLPPRNHPDALTISIMAQMLRGRQVDVFRERLLDEAAARGASTVYKQERMGGVLMFGSSHHTTSNGPRRLKQLRRTLDGMAIGDWITEDALDAVRRKEQMKEYISVYYAESQAERIGQSLWHLGSVEHAFDRSERLAAITPADVRRVWATWIQHGTPTDVIARSGAAPELTQ